MIENLGDIVLTDEYWDCECELDFIHHRSQLFCPICQCEQDDQPNSRLNEVQEIGLPVDLAML